MGAVPSRRPAPSADPLDDADPRAVADAAAVENLLRCWVRETNVARPQGDVLRLTLRATGVVLLAPVTYWSATGWHRFGRPVLASGPADAPTVDAPTLAALLSREAGYGATRHGTPPSGATASGDRRGEGGPAWSETGDHTDTAHHTDGASGGMARAGYLPRSVAGTGGLGGDGRSMAELGMVPAGEEGIYPVEGAHGSAYGGDGAAAGEYDIDGACGLGYGAVDGDDGAAARGTGVGGERPGADRHRDVERPLGENWTLAAEQGPGSLPAPGALHASAALHVPAALHDTTADPGQAVGTGRAADPGQAVDRGRAVGPGRGEQRAEAVSGDGAADRAELVGRVADSVRCTTVFLADRRAAPADPCGGGIFLAGEQALLLGHPLHPTPKSRDGLSAAETGVYSPELRGSFPLHWMAVRRSVLAADSAWTERGRPVPADQLIAVVAEVLPPLPDGMVPLPLHPWQAREVRHRDAVRALSEAGLLRDLGPYGEPWHPTSSVRTVYRPTGRAMLKLSLGLRITNSRRENLRKELLRGVEVHRLLRSGLAEEWRAACPGNPGFDIVRDPAWLAVDGPGGVPVAGLDVVIRHNPFAATDDVVCLAGLVSPRPWPGQRALRSRLGHLVARLAARTGRSVGAVSAEWFLRYLHTVVRPLLWLDGAAGVALEAHQQNTLVFLDADGWPTGGRYRDNQGYYFRESRRAALERRLPGIGAHSDTFVSDEVADERFAYYLGVNNVFGLIGAFGAQRLVDECLLLAAFRRFLGAASREPEGHRSALASRLLDAPTLRCKANMLTRLRGLDELVGPVDTQSVYVTIANPLAPSAR